MNAASEQLIELLNSEKLDIDLFANWNRETSTRIFGGHVIAQSLAAAYRTVEERMCHSLHAYFVRPNPKFVIIKWIKPVMGKLYHKAHCGHSKWKTNLNHVRLLSCG